MPTLMPILFLKCVVGTVRVKSVYTCTAQYIPLPTYRRLPTNQGPAGGYSSDQSEAEKFVTDTGRRTPDAGRRTPDTGHRNSSNYYIDCCIIIVFMVD